MLAAFLAVIAIVLAPVWWRARSQAPTLSPLSDMGQPQVAPAPRSDVARWTAQAALPEGRSRLALVSDGKRLYAIGGETAAGVTGQVTVYDPSSNGWLPGARKPTAVSNVAAVYLNDRIYVPGGTTATGGVTNVLEVYDPRTETWEARASLPVPLTAYGLAALGGKIYLFGGWDGEALSRRDVRLRSGRGCVGCRSPHAGAVGFHGGCARRKIVSTWWAATTGSGSWLPCCATIRRARARGPGPGRLVRR